MICLQIHFHLIFLFYCVNQNLVFGSRSFSAQSRDYEKVSFLDDEALQPPQPSLYGISYHSAQQGFPNEQVQLPYMASTFSDQLADPNDEMPLLSLPAPDHANQGSIFKRPTRPKTPFPKPDPSTINLPTHPVASSGLTLPIPSRKNPKEVSVGKISGAPEISNPFSVPTKSTRATRPNRLSSASGANQSPICCIQSRSRSSNTFLDPNQPTVIGKQNFDYEIENPAKNSKQSYRHTKSKRSPIIVPTDPVSSDSSPESPLKSLLQHEHY